MPLTAAVRASVRGLPSQERLQGICDLVQIRLCGDTVTSLFYAKVEPTRPLEVAAARGIKDREAQLSL